jgi:hypothetical protein
VRSSAGGEEAAVAYSVEVIKPTPSNSDQGQGE